MSTLSGSWYLSDSGIGTSIESNDTATVYYSSAENFENQVSELQDLREKLIREEEPLETIFRELKTRRNKFNQRRLQAERAILSISLRTRLLFEDFRKGFGNRRDEKCNVGCVTLSNVYINWDVGGPGNVRRYFLCSLTNNSTLFLSDICEVDSEGGVNFNINHTFFNMPADFEIEMNVFVMEVKPKNWRTKIKERLSCWFSTRVQNIYWCRESLFKLLKKTVITISDINEKKEILLDVASSKVRKLIFDVSAEVDTSGFCYMGWLDVSRNALFWNQRWCILKGTLLKYFNYPVEERFNNPISTIDLKSCLSVRIPQRNELSRSRVLVLEMNPETKNPFFFYLSTSSRIEFNQWKVLKKIIATLKTWKGKNV